MNNSSADFKRPGVFIYNGPADDLKRLAELLDRAAAETPAHQLTVTSPQAAEQMVRSLLAGLCQSYAAEPGAGHGTLYRRLVRLVDSSVVEAALRRTGGCQLRAAEILGINRNTLRSKMRDLGISGG